MKGLQYRKLFVAISLLFIAGGVFFASFTACAEDESKNVTKSITKKNTDFKVSAQYGIDGFVSYEYPAVVKVTVACDENFTGTLRIIPSVYEGQKRTAYAQDISLAKRENNTFMFIPSTLGENGRVDVEILDEKNKVVYAESDRITYSTYGGNNVVIGVLSDDYGALNYFDGIPVKTSLYDGTANTLELTLDSIPGDSSAISVLHYILIDNFDTARMSDEQYAVIKDWVNNGGILLLSLGANYQNVLHRFSDDFITGTLGNLEKTELTWSKDITAAFGEEAGDVLLTLTDVDAIEFEFDDAEELTGFSQNGTAYKKTVGAGAVVVLAYDLGMEPMTSFADKKTVARYLLQTTLTNSMTAGTGQNRYGNMIYNWERLAKLADNSPKPSALLYGGLLLLYVIIVGPVLYLILKALKKREKIWIAIPVVSLLFTGCIYLTGFIYRVNKPVVNTFSVVELGDGAKEEKIYTNVTCPRAQQYDIHINNGYTTFVPSDNDYYYDIFTGNAGERDYDYMIKQKTDGLDIQLNNGKVFGENSFMIAKTSENDMGSIDYDLKCYTTGFEGTVTNHTKYDLTDVVITFENHFYQVGNLKRGEQAVIDPDKIFESMGYDTFDRMYGDWTSIHSNKETYKRYLINTTMENNYVDITNYNHGYIWAGIASYEPEFIEESKVRLNGNGIIYQSYTEEYADIEGVYYPSLNGMIVTSEGDYDPQDGMLFDGDVTVTYSFEDYPGITRLENLSFGEKPPVSYESAGYTNVYAYNSETGDFELIFENGDMLSGTELQKYMDGNILILRYEILDAQYTSFMPRIAARGDR